MNMFQIDMIICNVMNNLINDPKHNEKAMSIFNETNNMKKMLQRLCTYLQEENTSYLFVILLNKEIMNNIEKSYDKQYQADILFNSFKSVILQTLTKNNIMFWNEYILNALNYQYNKLYNLMIN